MTNVAFFYRGVCPPVSSPSYLIFLEASKAIFAMVLDIIVVIDSQNAGILGDIIVLVF